tara:strand:- start:61 stop:162 length:102 start_codon:yes stop_codon:yes gene_type:complete
MLVVDLVLGNFIMVDPEVIMEQLRKVVEARLLS